MSTTDPKIPSAQPLTASTPAGPPTELAQEVQVLPPGAVRLDRIGRPIDARGKIVKGAKAVNLKGRPRTGLAFAEAVRELVDPAEVIAIALEIARGKPAVRDLDYLRRRNEARKAGQEDPPIEGVEVQWPSQSERMAAATFLRDSGYSKPPQQHEVALAPPPALIDYSKLTDEELDQLELLHAKAVARRLDGE